MKIKDISKNSVNKVVSVAAKVEKTMPGARGTMVQLKDETGNIDARLPVSGGISTPEQGTSCEISATVLEESGNLVLKIIDLRQISGRKKGEFLIGSQKLEQMKQDFQDAATHIKKAASEGRTIIIRHHDDADGYSSGFVIEKAILPFISDSRRFGIARTSSKSPYYDYIDALRDLNTYLSFRREGERPPLVLLLDLGSNSQSMKSISRLKSYGFDFIIIDHHLYDKENKDISLAFVNPHVHNFGSDLNAGALCTELALIINPNLKGVAHLPALSGVADKSSGDEFEAYLKLAGYEKKYLEEWASVIDHETYYLRFPEKTEILEDIFLPTERNKALIKSVFPMLEKEMKNVVLAAKHHAKIEDYGKFRLIRIGRDAVSWDYSSSKLPRIASSLIDGPRITFVETDDSISFRADCEGFDGIALIQELKEMFPAAMIDGGGHREAGTIKFSPKSKEEVFKHILDYVRRIAG
jgi:archaea-specific RecJ-like exonuclease